MSTRSGLGKCVVCHWEAWLLAGLLWFVGVDGVFMHDGRDTGSKAPPTWPWAPFKGCWQYVHVPIERGFPTVLVNTSWRTTSATDNTPKATWITLKGPFLSAKLEFTQSDSGNYNRLCFRGQHPRLFELDEKRRKSGQHTLTLSLIVNQILCCLVRPFIFSRSRQKDPDRRALST